MWMKYPPPPGPAKLYTSLKEHKEGGISEQEY